MSASTTVPIEFARQLLAGAGLAPERNAQLLIEAGIAPALIQESAARVTTEQFATLYQKLARDLDDELPGMFSRRVRNGTFKFLCLSLMEAPNVRTALYRCTRFFRLFLDDLEFVMSRQDKTTRIDLVPKIPAAANNAFAQEILLRLIHGLASWLAGSKLPLARIDFNYPRPGHAFEYVFLYPGPAHFDQALTAIYFDTRLLDMPIRQDKRSLGEFLRRAPGDWLFTSFPERLISHSVRDYLSRRMNRPTSIDEVARALHSSVRSLSRKLREEGSSFQAIKDELRRDVAIQLLTKTDKPLAVIGADLGFDSPATFHRAFKAWTGSTPGAYR